MGCAIWPGVILNTGRLITINSAGFACQNSQDLPVGFHSTLAGFSSSLSKNAVNMKNALLLALFLQTTAFTQSKSCQNLFIWPFSTDSGKRPELAKQMTLDMEEAFLKNNCTVFTSSDLPKLAEKIAVLPAVATVDDIPADIVTELLAASSDKLLIGRIRLDNGGNAIFQATIYSLPGKELTGTKKLMFSELEIQKDSLRKRKTEQILTLLPERGAPSNVATAPEVAQPVAQEAPGSTPQPPVVVVNIPPVTLPNTPETNPTRPAPRPKLSPPPPPKQEPSYEITFVVGKKVDRISVTGYGNLRLTKRNDGNQEASLKLKNGDYELRVFEDGKLKCNKFFKADRAKTIDFPCR
ncbi:MAG: hypothetical protein EPGJADBJ_04127 [Saprospiraceae bacterium]|nr:hypothetical protein [Saprospiraceae bacterium]